MNTKLITRLLNMYDYIYSDMPYRTKTVAFICYKGKVINFGVNSTKTHPLQNHYRLLNPKLKDVKDFVDKEHAEINAFRKLNNSIDDVNMSKVEIFVVSKKRDGSFRLARPCGTCMQAILDYGIRKIYYTTNDNRVMFECV